MHYPVDMKLSTFFSNVWISLKIYLTGEIIPSCENNFVLNFYLLIKRN